MCMKIKIHEDFALRENERLISSNNLFAKKSYTKKRFQSIKNLINQSVYGPAGLLHAFILSNILHRRLKIWQNDRIIYSFGNPNGKIEIDLEFQGNLKPNSLFQVGHWIVRNGNNQMRRPCQNDCFYEAVSSQINIDPMDLRLRIIRAMRHGHSITKLIFASINSMAVTSSLMGGATYAGVGPNHAKIVLDNSQSGASHPDGSSGHPRIHAYDESEYINVQNNSYDRWRSAFLSRDDQNSVCHYALITNTARNLMDNLNNGLIKADKHIGRSEIDYDPLPQARIWHKGNPTNEPGNFRSVCLVGKHFLKQNNNSNSPIFILTFYPIL